MTRYVHTNIIARDFKRLVDFYKTVFNCRSIGETRDLRGGWLDSLTGIKGSHITGEHLCLPGYGENHPTLEIFSYDSMEESARAINTRGIAHIAFEVDDVERTLALVREHGGGQIGEVVRAQYDDGRRAVLVYATDCEGNIIELQSWEG